jgi:hypothetical protein
MDLTLSRLDPERQRRRLRLLAALAEAKAVRDATRARLRAADPGRVRELMALRGRTAT